jgi:hypothetical protein
MIDCQIRPLVQYHQAYPVIYAIQKGKRPVPLCYYTPENIRAIHRWNQKMPAQHQCHLPVVCAHEPIHQTDSQTLTVVEVEPGVYLDPVTETRLEIPAHEILSRTRRPGVVLLQGKPYPELWHLVRRLPVYDWQSRIHAYIGGSLQ